MLDLDLRTIKHYQQSIPKLEKESDWDYKKRIEQRLKAKADNQYWNFRYRKGSYKARKSGLQPILMMAKRGLDMIRIYGEADEVIEPMKMQFASLRFKAWGQSERDIKQLQMPVYRKWLKDNRLTAKNNPFSYWLINIAP